MQADSTAAKETFVLTNQDISDNASSAEVTKYETHEAPLDPSQDVHQVSEGHQGSEQGGHPEPKPEPNGHQNPPITLVEHNDMEVRRHNLVNNYRPVQPLNGRTVYRSFAFFDQPAPVSSMSRSKSDPVYVKEPVGGSSTIKFSILALVISLTVLVL